MRRVIFMVDRGPWSDSVGIRIGVRDEERGTLAVAQPLVLVDVPPEDVAPETPVLKLWHHEAGPALQGLMDQLWALGVRPADIGTPGHLAATQAHLADFRAIVGKVLKVDFPGGKK